jgi:hypothetical protein
MSAADARENVEAAAWRVPGITAAQVDAILAASDAHAAASVTALIDSRARLRRLADQRAREDAAREERLTDADAAAAQHRQQLKQATRRPA